MVIKMEGISYFIEGTKEFFIQNGAWGLFILAFTEASFFPIPPDIVLLPLALLSPEKALYYAAITSAASTLGGIFGYLIGIRAGRPILSKFIKENNFHKMEAMFSRYGGWAVAVAGFTPIPYKVFTIASGVFHMKFITFFIAAVLSRSARFFLEGIIILAMGEKAVSYINRFLGPGSFVLLAVVALLYFLFKKCGITVSFKLKEGTLSYLLKQKLKGLAVDYGEFGIYLIAGFSIAAIFGILFFKLATEVLEREMEWFDRGIVGYIDIINLKFIDYASYIFDIMQQPMIFIILIILSLLYIKIFYKKNIYPAMAFVTLTGSFLLQWGFKSFYQRPRISIGANPTDFFTYSFPSGFIVLFTALMGYMAFLLLKNKNNAKRFMIIGLWVCLMVTVSVSRIHAGKAIPAMCWRDFY